MGIDLTQRRELSWDEKNRISVMMHYTLLDGIFRAAGWRKGDAVFHGGTSLKVNWMSPRYSEDLDFMVSDEKTGDLDDIVRDAKDKMSGRLMADLPNSDFRMRGEQTPDRKVTRYNIRWSHPKRIGKVMVKLEFYEAPSVELARYGCRVAVPDPDRLTRAAVTTPIVVAELESILADKIVALAKRPYFKLRDTFDFWYAHTRLKEAGLLPDAASMARMVEDVGAIYGYDVEELVEGLNRAVVTLDEVLAEIAADGNSERLNRDMGRWLPTALHEGYSMSGTYRDIVARTRECVMQTSAAMSEKELDLQGGMHL